MWIAIHMGVVPVWFRCGAVGTSLNHRRTGRGQGQWDLRPGTHLTLMKTPHPPEPAQFFSPPLQDYACGSGAASLQIMGRLPRFSRNLLSCSDLRPGSTSRRRCGFENILGPTSASGESHPARVRLRESREAGKTCNTRTRRDWRVILTRDPHQMSGSGDASQAAAQLLPECDTAVIVPLLLER
jgi:hypothetical protein